jgi:hypothetical protein
MPSPSPPPSLPPPPLPNTKHAKRHEIQRKVRDCVTGRNDEKVPHSCGDTLEANVVGEQGSLALVLNRERRAEVRAARRVQHGRADDVLRREPLQRVHVLGPANTRAKSCSE